MIKQGIPPLDGQIDIEEALRERTPQTDEELRELWEKTDRWEDFKAAIKARDEQREREVLNDLLGSAKVRTIQVPDWQTVDGSGELEIISTRWIKERLARLDSPKSDLVRQQETEV